MDALEARVLRAKTDREEMDCLTRDYLPFLKKQLTGRQQLGLEYDDMLSLAMLTFVGCARQYAPERGSFLGFCEICIRNRLTDEARSQNGYSSKVVLLHTADESLTGADAEASISAYDRMQEQHSLREEIESLSETLAPFGVHFAELPRICPKQERSRRQCFALAYAVALNEESRAAFLINHRLPQAELARSFDISPKTIEKHRKYIVALAVLLMGDYPAIRAYLPQYGEVSEA